MDIHEAHCRRGRTIVTVRRILKLSRVISNNFQGAQNSEGFELEKDHNEHRTLLLHVHVLLDVRHILSLFFPCQFQGLTAMVGFRF